ncbi:MAG: T9SS type A sorting domain-containing protein, partial [Fibrobacteres bacterium]|nr:T9SS type A sorting domain-containing protein [Fibrobacterota bacterium]
FSDVFDLVNMRNDKLGMYRLDYMAAKPVRDSFYDDLPSLTSLIEGDGSAEVHNAKLTVSPNPFNPAVKLSLDVVKSGKISLKIYDASGRFVKTLLNQMEVKVGRKVVLWDGRNQNGVHCAAGIYLCALTSEKQEYCQKITLVR